MSGGPNHSDDNCHTKDHLADEFAIATRLYYEAVVGMTRNHVPMSWTDYVRLRNRQKRRGGAWKRRESHSKNTLTPIIA